MRISDWSSDVCSSDLAEPNGKPCRSQRIAIVAGDPIRSQSESDERACDDNGTQSRQSDATQCPVSRHQSMQSSKPLIRLLALWLGRRSFPTQSDRGRSRDRKSVVSGKSVSVRVDLGGRRLIKNKNQLLNNTHNRTLSHYITNTTITH